MTLESKFFVNSFEEKIYRWKSRNAFNPFAPYWDTVILKDSYRLDETVNLLELVKEKEKTGLFANEQWTHYNIFLWEDSELQNLKKYIKDQYSYLCKSLNINEERTLYINGWVYPQKQNQTLKRHSHAIHENSFLSGNLILNYSTNLSRYHIPYVSDSEGDFVVESKPGTFLLFPSYLSHSTDTLVDKERYVIAFDIITQKGIDTFRIHNQNVNDPIHRAVVL